MWLLVPKLEVMVEVSFDSRTALELVKKYRWMM